MHPWILFKTWGIFRRFPLLTHPFSPCVSPSKGSRFPMLVDSNRAGESCHCEQLLSWIRQSQSRISYCIPLVGHLIWKESDAHPLAHPPIYSRPNAIEADSNISVVHATDFGSSLCKSRIRTAPRPSSSTPLDPPEGSRTFEHEYPSIQPIMFSRGYPDIARGIRTWSMC